MKKPTAPLLLVLCLCLVLAANAADNKPASKAAPRNAATAKLEPQAPITGALIERTGGNGGFLNLKIEGGNFTITFLDKNKKETKGDLSRAIIRYRRHLKSNQFILTSADNGRSLRSSLPVDRPYVFSALPVLLFKEGQESVAETYTVRLSQPMAGDPDTLPED